MPKTHPPYAPEFRQQIVELVRAGRSPDDLAREFEPSEKGRFGPPGADQSDPRPVAGDLWSPPHSRRLAAGGTCVGRKRVARLMRQARLFGVSRRKGIRTTLRQKEASCASDLVKRQFKADAPDQFWVADITYVPTWAGFLFLAVVIDAFSRRVSDGL